MKIEKLPQQINKDDIKLIEVNLAKNVRLARLKTGLSQKEMGEMIGYKSAVALSLIEDGKRKLSAKTLWKISRITSEPIKNFYLQGLI